MLKAVTSEQVVQNIVYEIDFLGVNFFIQGTSQLTPLEVFTGALNK